MKRILGILVGLAVGVSAWAEMSQVTLSGSCSTNSSATTVMSSPGNGLIYRAYITVTGGTSDVAVVSGDGATVLSTNTVAGTITVTPTPVAVVGPTLKTANANTNAATVKVTLTIQK